MATKRLAPPAGPALFLELLHGALARDGYLSPGAMQEIAEAPEASLADVYSAATFEHSIANMYFIPMGLLLKEEPSVREAAGLS